MAQPANIAVDPVSLTPFRPPAVMTMPVAVAPDLNTAHRAKAYSTRQRRVEVWGSRIVHKDDREVLSLFVHDRSSQAVLVPGTHCLPTVARTVSSTLGQLACPVICDTEKWWIYWRFEKKWSLLSTVH